MTKLKIIIFLCFFCSYLQVNAQGESTNLKKYLEIDATKPLLVGHRGGFYDSFPENSLALFQHTKTNACLSHLMIEVDIRQGKEGTLWIMHDETLDRTTNAKGNILITDYPIEVSKFLCND